MGTQHGIIQVTESRNQLGCKFGHVYRLIFRVAGYFEPPQVDAWHSIYTQIMVYHGLVLVGRSLCWKPDAFYFFLKHVFTMNLMMFPHHFHQGSPGPPGWGLLSDLGRQPKCLWEANVKQGSGVMTSLWLWGLHSHGFSMALIEIDGLPIKNGDFPWRTVSMAHRNRWFTELNSMVMASMAMLKLNNQMVPVMRLFFFL